MNREFCMTITNPDGIDNVHRKLQKSLTRSEGLRLSLLCLANMTGSLLVLAPALLCLAAGTGALHFGEQLNGPLDWFLFELLIVGALFCGVVAVDLLFTRPGPDNGVAVTRAQSPELFAMLERRLSHFRLENINRIYLDDGADIQIFSSPRWLLPFAHKRRLHIGTALLFFLSPVQFRLALAGAVSAYATTRRSMHGSLAQSQFDWKKIFEAINARNSISSKILRIPLGWIAALIVLLGKGLEHHNRQMQYRWLQENTDERSVSDLLAGRIVASRYLEEQYWPTIMKSAEICAEPVVHPFGHFEILLPGNLQVADARRWLLTAQASSLELRDLLAELGIDNLKWTGLPSASAFGALFNEPAILEQLDQYWRKQIEPDWNNHHQEYQLKYQRFQRLQKLASRQTLHGRSALSFVDLAAELLDHDQAIKAWQSTWEANHNDAAVCLACGQALLMADAIDSGRKALQRVVQLDPSQAGAVRKLLREYGVTKPSDRQQHTA
jgi:hypothetical protein